MSDIGLMFCDDMIRAFLAGRKSMTRRTRRLGGINENPNEWIDDQPSGDMLYWLFYHKSGDVLSVKCPFPVGANMWAKEVHAFEKTLDNFSASAIGTQGVKKPVWYKSGGFRMEPSTDEYVLLERGRWRSAMFMPKWAARIWRPIVSVRPERVQSITEEDARREGTEEWAKNHAFFGCLSKHPQMRAAFPSLWDRLNPKHPWSKDEWVWVLEFPQEVKP